MKKDKKERNKKSGVHSLNRQFTLVLVALVVMTVFLGVFFNTMFLEPYYVWNKERILTDSFEKIDAASADGTLESGEFDIEFEQLCANGNLRMIIINADSTVVLSSENNNKTMVLHFMEALFSGSGDEGGMSVIKEGENYVIQKQYDNRTNSEYLVMWGTLSDGKLVMARTALKSIRDTSSLTNRFLLVTGLIVLAISALAAGIVTRRITNPILQLTEISKRMTELDFEAKYSVSDKKRKNEIDLLGEHMNELSGKLEQTISELKSANNELLLDNARKTQIDEMRKEFLSNVSHELKTPLALIQGYAEGLQECINDDEESRMFYCEVIMDEADKMNRMVKKLLTLNHLEFGNEAVVMERFDLTELIAGVINASSILIQQNGISIDFDAGAPLYVWADEFKTEEVITNFLSNAIHYADGEKRIAITCEIKTDCVRVNVFNTGKPIAEEDLDKVWIKFYKADKARTREYGGSGIGLSIVKAIMDSFNRQCGVYNCEGGVVFWMELDTKN